MKKLIAAAILTLPLAAFAATTPAAKQPPVKSAMQGFVLHADKCPTLTCVRKEIDMINHQIVTLMGQRLAYVRRAGELKTNVKSVHDQKREDQIIAKVTEQAKRIGVPISAVQGVFKEILAVSNQYEKNYHHYKS